VEHQPHRILMVHHPLRRHLNRGAAQPPFLCTPYVIAAVHTVARTAVSKTHRVWNTKTAHDCISSLQNRERIALKGSLSNQ
jgi:hypothetical protein